MQIRCVLAVAAVIFAFATPALSQALPNLTSLRVRYNTQKNSAKPAGELKARLEQLDRAVADATRLGRTGELRRLFAEGLALLAGRPWTETDDFQASLALRTQAVVLDSSQPQTVRLEQIFASSMVLERPLHAVASLRPIVTPAPSAAPATSAPPAAATELARFDGLPRDLRESPFAMDLDLSRFADGLHMLTVAVSDGERPIGAASLRLSLLQGLDTRLRQLEARAGSVAADVQADLRYPADFILKINRGIVERGTFDVAAELLAAEAIASAALGGRNPFAGRTGGFERHYMLEAASEIMPYRIHVPRSYDGTRRFPLVVALHGLGGNEDGFMDSFGRTVPSLAEQRGYIVVSPLGFRPDGFYGVSMPAAPTPTERRKRELSELDVMEVLRRTRAAYKIDDARIYLMGHSMGAGGTWALGAKYPDIWAALAPLSGWGDPGTMGTMRHIAQIVVHGDADPTVNVAESRKMVAALREHGVDHTYIEVAGGDHNNMVVPNLPKVFDFFDAKRKAAPTRR
ncbi:MAG: hypothetical protein H0W08_23540 [Acidobacteria bacterium]|nr:hypothetical protein [Acidobacteriota bacterium]